jgi:hypothetical protein
MSQGSQDKNEVDLLVDHAQLLRDGSVRVHGVRFSQREWENVCLIVRDREARLARTQAKKAAAVEAILSERDEHKNVAERDGHKNAADDHSNKPITDGELQSQLRAEGYSLWQAQHLPSSESANATTSAPAVEADKLAETN